MHGCGAQLIPGPAVPWSPLGFEGQPALTSRRLYSILGFVRDEICGHETFGSSLEGDVDVRLALEVVKRVALHSVAFVFEF